MQKSYFNGLLIIGITLSVISPLSAGWFTPSVDYEKIAQIAATIVRAKSELETNRTKAWQYGLSALKTLEAGDLQERTKFELWAQRALKNVDICQDYLHSHEQMLRKAENPSFVDRFDPVLNVAKALWNNPKTTAGVAVAAYLGYRYFDVLKKTFSTKKDAPKNDLAKSFSITVTPNGQPTVVTPAK